MKSLLKINGFLPFLAIMFINASVDLGHKITIQNVLVKSADSSALIALTSLVNLLILLPYVFLFSVSGYLNDKFSRTRITRICAKLGVALTALITLGYACGWFYFAFFMTILLAAQSAIYSPAKYGLIKKIVGAKNLGAAWLIFYPKFYRRMLRKHLDAAKLSQNSNIEMEFIAGEDEISFSKGEPRASEKFAARSLNRIAAGGENFFLAFDRGFHIVLPKNAETDAAVQHLADLRGLQIEPVDMDVEI